MYTDDLITREELNDKIGGSLKEIERLENELKVVSYHLTRGEQLEGILNNTFKALEDVSDVKSMTNTQLDSFDISRAKILVIPLTYDGKNAIIVLTF